MRNKWLFLFLLAVPAQGQILSIIMGGTNQPAATPTFSPAAGAVTNPTTVTASTSTSDGCTIYFDTSNPPATAQTTYSVTTGVTLYAQARGCAHHSDSLVGSATYTISAGVLPVFVQEVLCTTSSCTLTSTTAGDSLVFIGVQGAGGAGDISAVVANVSGAFTRPTSCNYLGSAAQYNDAWILTNITGGDTSVAVTSVHGAAQMVVLELKHANTVKNSGSCYTLNTTSSIATAPGPSVSVSANQVLIESINNNNAGTDGANSASLPSSGAWTTYTPFNANLVGYSIFASGATGQLVGTNHAGNLSTSGTIGLLLGN